MNKKSKQILMIGPDCQGGITSVIKMYLSNGLSDVVIFMPSYKGGSFLSKLFCFYVFLAKYIYTLTFNKEIQLIHIHSSANGSFLRKFIALNIAKLFGKKILFHMHSSDFNLFYDAMPYFLKKLITCTLNKSTSIIALSEQWKIDIESKCSNKNIKILYNPTKLKTIVNRESDTINVLFMGILGKRKGAYDIIEAAKYIVNPNVKIIMYGDGEVAELNNIVKKYDLQDKVSVKGWISGDKILEAYKNTDIYILPSYNEGLPMSILEALGYGLPIISTPVGGIPEAVFDGVNGYLIEPGNYKALAEKIELLAANKDLRFKMATESFNIAGKNFDINIIINQLKEIYDELLIS